MPSLLKVLPALFLIAGCSIKTVCAQTAESKRAQSLLSVGQDALAMAEVDKLLKQKPDDIALLVARAEIENFQCLYPQAVKDCKQAIAARGDHSFAYATLAEAYLRMGLFTEAHDSLENAFKLNSKGSYALRFSEIQNLAADAKNAVASPAKKWALACTAYLFTLNKQGCESLAGAEMNEGLRLSEEKLLAEWWEVHNKAELLQQIRSMVANGHNQSWQQMRKMAATTAASPPVTVLGKANLDATKPMQLVKTYGDSFGDRGILAWDYCRLLCLCRWGYQTGYLSQDEAWKIMMPVAARIQTLFTSWKQLKTEYQIGREFWSASYAARDTVRVRTMSQRLFHDPKSPWLQNAWKTNLECKSDVDTIYSAIDSVPAN